MDKLMLEITNPIYFQLVDLGIINPETVKVLSQKTRDKDVAVLIDETSKVIFLQNQETSETYYEKEKLADRALNGAITSLGQGRSVTNATLEDDQRRFQQFEELTKGANICDFGCGYGGYLQLNKKHAKSISGVELRGHCKQHLLEVEPSIKIENNIQNFEDDFDVVTLFHVLEHLPDQISVLKDIRKKLKKSGQIIVEVPHALDFLIQSIDLPEFRNFTFWSEHLVLHTKASISKVLEAAGYTDISVQGYQRYNFTNHLGWLLDRKPGGHDRFSFFEQADFHAAYQTYMQNLSATDTLMVSARPSE